MKIRISIYLAILALALAACLENDISKNTDDINYRTGAEFAAPIGTVRMPLARLIIEQLLDGIDEDIEILPYNDEGVLTIRYKYVHEFIWAEVEIDDFYMEKREYTVNSGTLAPVPLNPGVYSYEPSPFKVKMSPIVKEDRESFFTEVLLSDGTMTVNFDMESTDLSDYEFTFSIHDLFDREGNVFTHVFTEPEVLVIDNLNGYTLKATKADVTYDADAEQSTVYSEAEASVKIVINTANGSVPSGIFFIDASFVNLNFDEVTGYFGQVQVDDREIEDGLVSFFEELEGIEGDFGVHNMIVEIDVTNNVDMPIWLEKGEVYFVNANNQYKDRTLEAPYFELITDFSIVPATYTGNTIVPGKYVEEINKKVLLDREYPYVLLNYVGINNRDNHPALNAPFVPNYLKKDNIAHAEVVLTMPFDLILDRYSDNFIMDFKYKEILNDDETLNNSIEEFYLHFNILNNTQPFSGFITIKATRFENDPDGIELAVFEIKAPGRNRIRIENAKLRQLWNANPEIQHLLIIPDIKIAGDGKIKENSTLDISVGIEFKSNLPISLF